MAGKRREKREGGQGKGEVSPQPCVEHAVIRDEPGHGGRRHKRQTRRTEEGFKGGKVKKYVGWKTHMANHKKRSQCGNEVCTFFSSALFFLSVEKEAWCVGVMNWLVWAASVTSDASKGVIMVFDKCT